MLHHSPGLSLWVNYLAYSSPRITFFFCIVVIPNPPFIMVPSLQALVQLLRTEGVQLGDKPVPPEDTIKLRPKRYGDQLVNFDDMPEWVSYW